MDNPRYLFASDIHLSPSDKNGVADAFRAFLETAGGARGLFLLGDLFDYWVGRSMLEAPSLMPVFEALRGLARDGTEITLLPGNRDFLLGDKEAGRLGARMGEEMEELQVGDERILLTHGDIFCTQDRNYQRMKRVLRNRLVVLLARSIPEWLVRSLAGRLRRHSSRVVGQKSARELSLDRSALVPYFLKGFTSIICGHIHSQVDEYVPEGGRLLTLSDWTESEGSYAEFADGALTLKTFSL
jgi:UDP-2,3-diacylglucosamine hydrolase